ncbi:MAG: Maf family nucleotide pyrophosphatase [Bacteroidales bacterium]|nr:Maf family nucleotide pyrophosphatase [Bacteroidales bacterium]MCL2133689.1 Maf family nucleotide pyrophosphatase [Bacteroidales bacterium]
MLLTQLQAYKIILASGSPRRQELLKGMGIDYTVELNGEVDESYPSYMPLREVPTFLARTKSHALGRPLADNELLITADTVVICNNRLLNKPLDIEDAKSMLQLLSGNSHEVHTGVCVRTQTREHLFTAKSVVHFRSLSADEIDYYIKEYRPFDKAGSYGVQEWIGYIGIDRIEGSYFNVMGLPTQQLYVELCKFVF